MRLNVNWTEAAHEAAATDIGQPTLITKDLIRKICISSPSFLASESIILEIHARKGDGLPFLAKRLGMVLEGASHKSRETKQEMRRSNVLELAGAFYLCLIT